MDLHINADIERLAVQAEGNSDTVLRAVGLNLSVKTRQGRSQVLRDISFGLKPGQTLGLVGESGAGKSMLGRVISRQLPRGFQVDSGELRFKGQDLLNADEIRHRAWLGRRIAFIPQEPMTALNPVLTIGQQFTEHLLRLGVPLEECRAQIVRAFEDVLLTAPEELLDKYAFQLSGGMCQRVMIAMAFAGKPDLVISDEATTALDVSTQAQVVRLLRELQEREGTAVIFVTHDMGLATHVCDEVAVLYAGEVMERAPAKEVFQQTLHPYTRALRAATPELSGVMRRLDTLDGQMPGVEVFPSLTGCRFASRCEHCGPACEQSPPAILQVNDDHWVRCIRSREIGFETAIKAEEGLHEPGSAFSQRSVLNAREISKVYPAANGRQKATTAVSPMDLSVAPGEFVGIVGESGSGKSTLARLLMGLEDSTSGAVELNGELLDDSERSWRRRISSVQMVFQDARSALNPRRKVGKLLTQAMDSRSHQRLERKLRMVELARDVGLAEQALTRYPAQLSGGQRQRVNIGRSLCDLPQVLIADEIVSGLDVSVQAQIMNLLLELRKEHKVALVIISHDLGVVRYLCSRILVMRHGEVVESGPTEQVLSAPQHPYTRELIAAVPPTDANAIWPPPVTR